MEEIKTNYGVSVYDITFYLVDEDGNEISVSVNYLYIQLDDLAPDEYVQVQVATDDTGDVVYDDSWYNNSGGQP